MTMGLRFRNGQLIVPRKNCQTDLKMDFDPSNVLVDKVKVRHNLKPYGLNDKEWRCYLMYLNNEDRKNATLVTIARKLVMEFEPKITEVESIRDSEKNPLSHQGLKACNLYLKHIKTYRIRIEGLVDCFLVKGSKRHREKSVSSDSETDVKHQN